MEEMMFDACKIVFHESEILERKNMRYRPARPFPHQLIIQAFEEMDFYISIPQRLSFVDTALLFLSKKLNARLVTFDKQLERIANVRKAH